MFFFKENSPSRTIILINRTYQIRNTYLIHTFATKLPPDFLLYCYETTVDFCTVLKQR